MKESVFVDARLSNIPGIPCRKVQHSKPQSRKLHALWNRVWLTHDGTSAGTRDVLNLLRKKELHFIIGGYRLHTTVPKYTSTRSVYPLHNLVPRYDVHEKQLTSTLKAEGFVMYSWSEIPRLWISNPSKREYLPDCVHRSQDCGSRTLQRSIIKLAKLSGVYDPKTVDHNGSTQIRYTKFSSSQIEETHAQRHFGYGVKRIFISFFYNRRLPAAHDGAQVHLK